MDLRRLEYFLAVVEHGRVTAAAASLQVAQPSLSQAIRALERDLGVELFHRDGRGLTPTAAGEALIEPARRALRGLTQVRAAVGEVVDLAAGWLDVAACDLLALDPLVAVLAAFHRRHDGVPVRVREPRDADDLVRLVLDGRCELALSYLPLPPCGLSVTPLGAQEIRVLLPPDSPVGPGPVTGPALAGMSVVDTIGAGEVIRTEVRAVLAGSEYPLPTSVHNRHHEAVVPLVLAGAGIAFSTAAHADDARRAGAVVRSLDPPLWCDFGLVCRDGALSPAARGFVEVLLGELDLPTLNVHNL